MGVIAQPLKVLKQNRYTNLPIQSENFSKLFIEFLRRYTELKLIRRKEELWLIGIILTGSASFFELVYVNNFRALISFILFIVFTIALKRYLFYKNVANHEFINVHILHHHLLGKLDVGFCEHQTPCKCAENFRKYVLETYGVSLYNDNLVY